MRTVLRASLRRHTRRYVAAAVAVTIGVAFIVVTNALSSSVRNGMVAGVQAPYAHADVVVSDIDGDRAGQLIERARKEGDHVSVLGWSLQRVGKDGHLIADRVDVGAVTTDPTMRWQTLEDGRFPTGPGEAVADYNDAKSNDVEVGDTLQVGSGDRAVDVRVVGMVDSAVVGGLRIALRHLAGPASLGVGDVRRQRGVRRLRLGGRSDHGRSSPTSPARPSRRRTTSSPSARPR